jgi:hypothetical protein
MAFFLPVLNKELDFDRLLSSCRSFLIIDLELPTLPEHQSSHPVFGGVRVTRSVVLYVMFCRSLLVLFFLFSSPCQRQCGFLPSLGVRRLSSVNFSYFNLLL